jgi:tight adherence protein B
VSLAVAALCLGADTGGAQARAVDGVAMTIRSRLAVAGEVRALASQARVSALVIAVSPVAFGAFAAATDRRSAGFLFRTPLGLSCLVAGLALDAVAAAWMARITRVAA